MTKAERLIAVKARLPQIMAIDPKVYMALDKDNVLILEMDNRAMLDFYQDTGINLLASGITVVQLEDPAIVGHMLHRSAQRHQPAMTWDMANQIINPRQFVYIFDCLMTCIKALMPDIEDIMEDEENSPKDPK